MSKINVRGKIILVTGGTGSLGQVLVHSLLRLGAKEIRIYSRDEFKQSDMARKFNNKKLKFLLGDIRGLDRIKDCCEGVDYIFHTAAAKRMDQTSVNVFEISDINIRGTRNVMLAGKNCKKVIFVSSDKAFQPSCAYGSSKMIGEKIVLAYDNGIVWRFGNFEWSRGSIWEILFDQWKKGEPFTLTDPRATRFVIPMCLVCSMLLSESKHGLYFPKKMKSMTVKEIADSIAKDHPFKIIGLREGEKLDEEFTKEYTSRKK